MGRVKSVAAFPEAIVLYTNMTKLNFDMAMECSMNRPVYLLYRPQRVMKACLYRL